MSNASGANQPLPAELGKHLEDSLTHLVDSSKPSAVPKTAEGAGKQLGQILRKYQERWLTVSRYRASQRCDPCSSEEGPELDRSFIPKPGDCP
jgi:hypothetical protein